MQTISTWRDHPTCPSDEPPRRCGIECELLERGQA